MISASCGCDRSVVVHAYDEALKWYTNVIGFKKTDDGSLATVSWLVVLLRGQEDLGIVLESAKPDPLGANMALTTAHDKMRSDEACVGMETWWVLEVEDCRRFHKVASKRRGKFFESPADQP
jgi:hypothetical protein